MKALLTLAYTCDESDDKNDTSVQKGIKILFTFHALLVNLQNRK